MPFVAQQLQAASNYLSWRQVERLQLIYNYSCRAGDYYRSYYRTTLEFYNNMTTAPNEVVNVEVVNFSLGPVSSKTYQNLQKSSF